jgi:NAD(P)-dependent dehydrogenase (short-subunit alcohol dehydrogenase family)
MLILTQGILTMAGRTPTAENIDNKLALHYYGRVLFVQELLPLLRSAQNGGKVLFVLDSVHGNPNKVNWNDMSLENAYSLYAAANHATSFTDLVIQHFASQPENANVTFTHAGPGAVRTQLIDSLPFWARLPLKGAMAIGLGVSPDDCAEYMIHGMFGTDKGCRYVNNKGEAVTKKKVPQEEMVQKVWEHTSRMISSVH